MHTRKRLSENPVAEAKDRADEEIAKWGRSRHEGFRKFKHNFIQPTPLLFTQDHHPLWLGDIYRGRSAFLIAGGPSFANLDHAKLRQPGVLTMGLNNSVKTFRSNMWVSVDPPDHFIRSIWLDPTNRGSACYVRLLVSVFSLRKHYQGAITVMQEGEMYDGMREFLRILKAQIQPTSISDDCILVKKTSLWREMRHDRAMYLDADTVVRGPVDEFLGWIQEWGFTASWFNGW